MNKVYEEALQMLADMGVTPALGGLIPEKAAAALLGYSYSHFRQLASQGRPILPYILRGNRRRYKIDDIVRFVSEPAE